MSEVSELCDFHLLKAWAVPLHARSCATGSLLHLDADALSACSIMQTERHSSCILFVALSGPPIRPLGREAEARAGACEAEKTHCAARSLARPRLCHPLWSNEDDAVGRGVGALQGLSDREI